MACVGGITTARCSGRLRISCNVGLEDIGEDKIGTHGVSEWGAASPMEPLAASALAAPTQLHTQDGDMCGLAAGSDSPLFPGAPTDATPPEDRDTDHLSLLRRDRPSVLQPSRPDQPICPDGRAIIRRATGRHRSGSNAGCFCSTVQKMPEGNAAAGGQPAQRQEEQGVRASTGCRSWRGRC